MLYLAPDHAFDGVFLNMLRQADPAEPAMTARLVVAADGGMIVSIHLEPMARWPGR